MSDAAATAPAFHEPGVYYGLAAETYHADPSLGHSGAIRLLQSPAHYRVFRTAQKAPTPAMQFGSAVHALVLEQERSKETIAICPDVDKRTKDGKLAWAAFEELEKGKIWLTTAEFDRAARCAAAVMEHPMVRKLLDGAHTEVSVFWSDLEYSVPCKARYDILPKLGAIVDLKTTRDASPEGFAREIANYDYPIQGAHYWSGHEHALDRSPAFFGFIAVETEEPFAVACYYLPPVAIQAGRRRTDEALARFRKILESGEYPGYSEKILPIDLPRWYLRDTYSP